MRGTTFHARTVRLIAVTGLAIAGLFPGIARADTYEGSAGGLDYSFDSSGTVAPGADAHVDVQCVSGNLTGGGWQVFSPGGDDLLAQVNSIQARDGSDPGSGPGDLLTLDIFNATLVDQMAYPFAICSAGDQSTHLATDRLPGHATHTFRASCPHGTHVTGGGVLELGPNSEALINSSYPYDGPDRKHAPDDGWKVRLLNLGGGRDVTVDAICQSPAPRYKVRKQPLLPGDHYGTGAFCDASSHVLGGGARLTGPAGEARVTSSDPEDGSDHGTVPDDFWGVIAANAASGSHKTLTSFAICQG